MTDTRRVFLVIFLHYLAGLLGCLFFAYFHPDPVSLIAPFTAGYRLRSGVLLFVTYMPALQISGLLIGYALVFKNQADTQSGRWSELHLKYLKGAFLLCLACLSFYFIMTEGISPALKTRQLSAVNRTEDFRDCIVVAQSALASDNPAEAVLSLEAAIRIWPRNSEANELMDRSKYRLAELEGSNPSLKKEKGRNGKIRLPGLETQSMTQSEKGITVLQALDRSAEADKKHDFFNAHYYAMLAWRLARDNDPNKAVALRLAASAWNRISEGSDKFAFEGDIARYKVKRAGYDAIQNGDYLAAYYILLAESQREKDAGSGPIDPDVERFLEVARKGLLESFFFIDETVNIRLFESARDVFFINRRADGNTDAVFIRGMTYMHSGEGNVAYLRDLELARFDGANKLVYRIAVPYAKMFPFSMSGSVQRPELILHAVDRYREGSDVFPSVLEGEVSEQEKNIILLDMPYRDIGLLIAANRGASGMSLMDMIGFSRTAAKYGFSRDVYQREIIMRLAEPFLILILSIYALILGWKYRLGKNTLFKAWWALCLPLFPLITLFIIETVRYLARISIVAFVALVPENGLFLTLSFLSFCFLLVSVAFFAQRSD